MNARAKGQRTFAKFRRYALSFPGTTLIPIYQVSRWAAPQPFDAIMLRGTFWPRFVEVRTNQFGVSKPQTRRFASLPSEMYRKQIWRFRDRCTIPDIREWQGRQWVSIAHPWEGE